MAKAIPAIVGIGLAVATGGASAVLAGTATFAQFASVAGATLSGIGALTNSKDLSKIGSFMSLAGGLGSALTGGAAAAPAADMGSSSAFGDVSNAFGEAGAEEAAKATLDSVGSAGPAAAPPDAISSLGKMAPPDAEAIGGSSTLMGSGSTPTGQDLTGGNLMTQPALAQTLNNGSSLMSSGMPQGQVDQLLGRGTQATPGVRPALMDAAQSMDQNSIGKYLNSAEKWAKEHKTILDIGLKGVASMTDPNQRALEDRRRMLQRYQQNLNSPVALGNIGR